MTTILFDKDYIKPSAFPLRTAQVYLDTVQSSSGTPADLQARLLAASEAHKSSQLADVSNSNARLVSHTHRTKRTVDTEDTDAQLLRRADGTLVTERRQTTGHEVLCDDEPETTTGREVVDDQNIDDSSPAESVILHEQVIQIVA